MQPTAPPDIALAPSKIAFKEPVRPISSKHLCSLVSKYGVQIANLALIVDQKTNSIFKCLNIRVCSGVNLTVSDVLLRNYQSVATKLETGRMEKGS